MQLVRFLMKMTSEYVQVELKDGTVVAGTVANILPNMNTILKDVKMTSPDEDPLTMDSITLRGNSIRYFVLPESINLDSMITDDTRKPRTHLPPLKRRRPDPSKSSSRGSSSGRGISRGASRGFTRQMVRGRGRGGFRASRGNSGGSDNRPHNAASSDNKYT